jgi:phosphatidylserine synthase
MNLPNTLTILRIFFAPLLVVVLLTREPNVDLWGLPMRFEIWGVLILLAAAATDWADGYFARRHGEVTTLGILLGGAVVVETVFSWPGMGRLAAQGILNNDSVLVVGFTLFVATMMVLVNLVVDILYAVVDPRVRY